MKRKRSIEHAAVRASVKAVVDALDPEGLLRMGCPDDEYDPEIESFTAAIAGGEEVTAARVREIWEGWFGAYPRTNYEAWTQVLALKFGEIQAEYRRLRIT